MHLSMKKMLIKTSLQTLRARWSAALALHPPAMPSTT